MCDGDLFDLPGMRHFDRMTAPSHSESTAAPNSMVAIWGANHNYFNTEWHLPDFDSLCAGPGHAPIWNNGRLHDGFGPEPLLNQQRIALTALDQFFRAHVGTDADPERGRFFDPASSSSHVDRSIGARWAGAARPVQRLSP